MDPFIGQLMLAPYNFAPKGWAFCAGQLLPISQNTALFSLLGTQYGGDGKSNFQLPNLQGCVPIGSGQGPGLSLYQNGETGGTASVTLTQRECPSHSHNVQAVTGRGETIVSNPVGATFATPTSNYYASGQGNQTLNNGSVNMVGSGQPHDNQMPYQVLNWFIALQGIFPSRS